MVGKAKLEVGEEAGHVLEEALAGGIGESTDCQHGLFMNALLALRLENHEQRLHDGVRRDQDDGLGLLTVAQLLHNDLDDTTQQPLHIDRQLNSVCVMRPGTRGPTT